AEFVAHRDVFLPHVRAPGRVPSESVEVAERKLEEAEPVDPASPCLLAVRVTRETGDHRDVWIDRMADRDAFALERLVVLVDPLLRFLRVDEGERQRAQPMLRGETNRVAVR